MVPYQNLLKHGAYVGTATAIVGGVVGAVALPVNPVLGFYAGSHVGGVVGFATAFIASYHIQSFIQNPVESVYPFAPDVTPDSNKNGVADVFEKAGENLRLPWTQGYKK